MSKKSQYIASEVEHFAQIDVRSEPVKAAKKGETKPVTPDKA